MVRIIITPMSHMSQSIIQNPEILSYALSKFGSIIDIIWHTIIDDNIEMFNKCMELDFNINEPSINTKKTLIVCAFETIRPQMLKKLIKKGACIKEIESLFFSIFPNYYNGDQNFKCIKILIKAEIDLECLRSDDKYYFIAQFIKKSIKKYSRKQIDLVSSVPGTQDEFNPAPIPNHINGTTPRFGEIDLNNMTAVVFDNMKCYSLKATDQNIYTLVPSTESFIDHVVRFIVNNNMRDFCESIKLISDIDEPDSRHNSTLLMHAAQRGHYNMVKILLGKGASISAGTRNKSALTFALYSPIGKFTEQNFKCVKTLIKAGSDISFDISSQKSSSG